MARTRNVKVPLHAVGDFGAARLDVRNGADGRQTFVRQADAKRFAVLGTDQHHSLGGVLQALPRPIDVSFKRGVIDLEQHCAAERYARDHATSYDAGVRGIDYDNHGNARDGGNPTAWRISDRRAEAALSFGIASKLVSEISPAHRHIVDRVVLDEVPASHAAAEWTVGRKGDRMPARNGVKILRQALDLLAAFYRAEASRDRVDMATARSLIPPELRTSRRARKKPNSLNAPMASRGRGEGESV